MQICASSDKSSQILPQRPTIYGAGWGVNEAPFTRKRCENETESLRIVSDTIGFGQSDRRLFTRKRWRDVQRPLRLVRRRSRASFVARRRVQNVNMRGLGHCAPQTDRDSTAVSKCIEELASACYYSSFFFSLETFHKKKMRKCLNSPMNHLFL